MGSNTCPLWLILVSTSPGLPLFSFHVYIQEAALSLENYPTRVLCRHLANSIKPKAFPHYKASLLNLLPGNSYLTFPQRQSKGPHHLSADVWRWVAHAQRGWGTCQRSQSKVAAKRHTKGAVPWLSHHTTVTLLIVPICHWIFIKSSGPS